MEKEVEIKWQDKPVKITLIPLTWGQEKAIRYQSIVVREHKGTPMQFRDTDKMEDLRVLAMMKDPPFPKVMDNLDKLSISDRVKLVDACFEIENANYS